MPSCSSFRMSLTTPARPACTNGSVKKWRWSSCIARRSSRKLPLSDAGSVPKRFTSSVTTSSPGVFARR
ncbi:Uncharacterised protein [Mycobacteroides abscessus subsp. abscessus]|nr:Uncharacterised protein [Mycobacteroides abscessus subsp. abscessus]